MSRWFRVYDDLVDDPKVQRLPAELFKALVNLWCLASQNDGVLPPIEDIVFKLRLSPARVGRILIDLTAAGLLEEADGRTQPHNWSGRQFKSDAIDPTNADRQKRFRNRQRNGPSVTDSVTPKRTETEQITDTEKKEIVGPRRPTPAPENFEAWWKSYPRTPIMSKKQALIEWKKLPESDQLAAIAAVPRYREFLRSKPDHPAVHGCRFLSQRRFEGFDEPAPAAAVEGFHAQFGSVELDAWDAHWRATKGKNCPRDRTGGWRFPTQWPPGYEPTKEAAE